MAYIIKAATRLMTVVETTLFLRQAAALWSENERTRLVDQIAANPEEGDIIPDTGGIRKLRWARQGTGKRGGTRVIYFFHDDEMPLYLLMVYSKAQRTDLTPDDKRRIKTLLVELKRLHGR